MKVQTEIGRTENPNYKKKLRFKNMKRTLCNKMRKNAIKVKVTFFKVLI